MAPRFELELESFTVVTIDAADEAAARMALGALLKALSVSEYAIGEARLVEAEPQSRSGLGRPPSARRHIKRILKLRGAGVSISAIARTLKVDRSSIHRALVWARETGFDSP